MNIRFFNSFSLLAIVFLGLVISVFLLRPSWQIGGDGFGYYSYIRSIVFDNDLDLHNEFALFDSLYNHKTLLNWQTATGQLANPFSIGPSILWAPFVFLAKVLTGIFYFRDTYTLAGYNWPFQAAVALGTWFYFLLGISFIFQALLRFFSKQLSFWAVLATIAVSPAPFYLIYEPSMSHGLTLFSTGLFFYTTVRIYKAVVIKWYDFLLLGLATGLLFLIRWQDIIFFIMAIAIIGQKIYQGKDFRKYLKGIILSVIIFGLTILPQLLMWRYLFGHWIAVPQGQHFFDLSSPHFWQFLFSSYHGLFIVHPLLILSIVGLIFAGRRYRYLVVALFVGIFLQVYLNAGLADWYGGGSFGARRMVSSFFIFCFGFAGLFDFLKNKKSLIVLLSLFIIISFIFNGLLMMAYAKKIIPLDSFTSYPQLYGAPLKVLQDL